MNGNELITMVERKEIVIIERPVVTQQMGAAGAFQQGGTLEDFLEGLARSIKPLEAMGVSIGDIEIITDGENFAATMKMGR